MAVRRYAAKTDVNSSVTRAEIERVLVRYGATAFHYNWNEEQATIGFQIRERVVKFVLPLPSRKSREITHTPDRGWLRNPETQEAVYDQAVRQRWRALLLIIKAKLEAIEAGIVTLESEFLAQTMLADGSTVGEWVEPQIAEVYRTGGMPSLLPGVQPKALPGVVIHDVD